jgi:AcrR family transcriptional regulator
MSTPFLNARSDTTPFPNHGSITGVGRPRKISDEDLMAACGRVIGRHGPAFTLAQVAAEAGVGVGTVAGRFGSKHGLMSAMMTTTTAHLADRMRTAAARQSDPVAAVLAAARVVTEGVADPAETTNHLAQLGVDMSDPDLREGLAALRAEARSVLRDLLAAADLPGAPPPARAARIIAALAHGTTLDWSIDPSGPLTTRLRTDLSAVLEAWRG